MHQNRELLMRVLGIVVAPYGTGPSFSAIDDFLQLESGTSKITLQGLASLFKGLGSDGTHPSILFVNFSSMKDARAASLSMSGGSKGNYFGFIFTGSPLQFYFAVRSALAGLGDKGKTSSSAHCCAFVPP
jgi:hypothetical protein